MREILFRAKRMDNGGWVEGYYFCMTHTDGRHVHHFIIPLGADLSKGTGIEKIQVEIDPETLCQYTGLKDKNGNRIWENDILQNARNNDLYTVKWHGSFGMYVWSKRKENNKHIFDYGDLYLMNRKCVVIGNIFDDPELLKGE